MATTVKPTPDIVNQLSQILIDTFGDVSKNLATEISKKAVTIANKKTESIFNENLKAKFKESGLLGFTKDLIFKSSSKEKPKEQRLIKEEEGSKKILIDGLTDKGYRDLAEKMPDILKGVFDKFKTKENKEKANTGTEGGGLLSLLPPGIGKLLSGALMAGGGVALLLGGLAALITGLNTDGPFKGLLKILSRVGISGGLKLLEKGALSLIKNLKSFVNAPIKLFQTAYKALRGIFGKSVSKTLTGAIAKTPGLLTKMLGGLVKFIKPLLKRLPLIGTVISLSFAYTRFKSGDVVGGIIDVLSGVATLIPGAGTAISIGLDVLNAFLDAKAGGATGETSQKKAGMIGDFFGKIYDYIGEKLSGAFSWVVEIGKKVIAGNWGEAFVEVAKLVPAMGWVVDLMGGEETVTTAGNAVGGQSINFLKGVKDYIFDKFNKALGWVGKIGELVFSGKWGDVIGELAKVSPGIKWVVDLMGGEETVTEAANQMGTQSINIFQSIKDGIMEKMKPVFGKFIDIGKKLTGGDAYGGIVDLCKITPGLGWLGNLLDSDATKEQFQENMESGNIWGSMSDLFGKVREGILKQMTEGALNALPPSLFGYPIRAKVAQLLGVPIPEGAPTETEWPASMLPGVEESVQSKPTTQSGNEPTPMATGGIVTKPLNAIVGEAGPEAVIPLDKYMSPEGFKLSNNILEKIAYNTANSNDTIINLSKAILQLADIFAKKQSNNVIVAGQNQQQQYPSASQVAASNIDPIRQIRMQFV